MGVVLFNLSQKPYQGQHYYTPVTAEVWSVSMVTVKEGDRIAQLVLEKIETPAVMETTVSDSVLSIIIVM